MKNILFPVLTIALLFTACQSRPAGQKAATTEAAGQAASTPTGAETFQITTGQINWTATKVGGQHLGTVDLAGGSISSKGNEVVSGSFEVDMTSIANIDLGEDRKGKLEGHLKSPDFFSVEEHPKASFTITGAKQVSDQATVTHEITGDLTIKGIVKSITIPANISFVGEKLLAATPAFTIDRTDWDVKYGSGVIGTAADKIIHDEVSLVITFEAAK